MEYSSHLWECCLLVAMLDVQPLAFFLSVNQSWGREVERFTGTGYSSGQSTTMSLFKNIQQIIWLLMTETNPIWSVTYPFKDWPINFKTLISEEVLIWLLTRTKRAVVSWPHLIATNTYNHPIVQNMDSWSIRVLLESVLPRGPIRITCYWFSVNQHSPFMVVRLG